MHSNGLILIFSLFFYSSTYCLIDIDLIQSYLSEKSAKDATIFCCLEKRQQISLAKKMMGSSNRKISVLNIIKRRDFLKNLQTEYGQISVILDGDCPDVSKFLIKCGKLKLFDVKHHWLIISPTNKIFDTLRNVTLNINADLNVAIPAGDDNALIFDIVDVYNPAAERGGSLNATQLGHYTKVDGFAARFTQAKYWLRKNMTGVTFKTIVVLPVAFKGSLRAYLDSNENRDVNTFNRFHSRLVHFCRDYYNFTLDISVEKSWGYTYPNGSFDGMVGALERHLIDFGISPLFVRADRGRVITYGRLTWVLRAAFLFRNPKTVGSIKVFLRPLSTSIWLITAALSFVAIILLKFVTLYEKRKFRDDTETNWSSFALVTLGAFCQQGASHLPRLTCGRIVTIFIFFLSVLIYQFYSASIVSTLLMTPVTTIKNLEDLLESPIKIGCEDILYTKDFLIHTTDRTARKLYTEKIETSKPNHSSFLPPETGLDMVKKGGYAFHVEVATAYPIIEQQFLPKTICELREVQLFRTQPMHANYQKDSPFRDMLDTCLQRLGEHGIIKREIIFWHPRKPECLQEADSSTFNVGIDEFYPVLVILFCGIVSSVIILIAEIQICKLRARSQAHPPVLFVKAQQDNVIKPFVK